MEIYAVMKVNDSNTGELLEKIDGFFISEECESVEEFDEKYGEDICEYMKNKLEYNYEDTEAIIRLDFLLLDDDFSNDK